MKAYDDYLEGNLPPYEYPKEKMEHSIERLKALYPWIEELPYKLIKPRKYRALKARYSLPLLAKI